MVVHPSEIRRAANDLGEAWADEAGPALSKSARSFAGFDTGDLRRSIWFDVMRQGGRVAGVRFGSHLFYAAIHHEGRGPVFPVHAKVLRWFDKVTGEAIFRKSAGPAKENPYLYLALKALGLRRPRRTT